MDKDLLDYRIFLEKSDNRKLILKSLYNQDQVAVFLSKELKKDKSVVSRTLKELEQEDLAECLNPNEPKFKRYKITLKGKQIIDEINELE